MRGHRRGPVGDGLGDDAGAIGGLEYSARAVELDDGSDLFAGGGVEGLDAPVGVVDLEWGAARHGSGAGGGPSGLLVTVSTRVWVLPALIGCLAAEI